MFLALLLNNLPQIMLGACWTGVMFWLGMKFQRWRDSDHWFKRRKYKKIAP